MKLNPPASSSDLEAAREVARRLHQRRRRADFARRDDARSPLDEGVRPAPHAAIAAPPDAFAPAHSAARPRAVEPPPRVAPPAAPEPALPAETAPPSWDDAAEDEPASIEEHLTGALGDLTGDLDGPPAPAESAESEAALDEGEEHLAGTTAPGLPGIDVEDASVSPDELVGSSDDSGADDGADDESLFGDPLGDHFERSSPAESAEPVAAFGATEELFDEPPPPPSWDDVVETCRELAGATGAMIIDPAGQVFSARGDWPEPGPDAIAGRLVAMMERTLKDAPTRSVSAPVGGHHLTAWRVPLAEGLVTAAFIADQPLRSDVRSAIDAEIHRGAGA